MLLLGVVVSTVDFAAVSNAIDSDDLGGIVNLVDDSEVAYANSPVGINTCQLTATGGTRVLRKLLNCCYHVIVGILRKSPEIFLSSALD
jgi:hypothetical protein